VPAGRGADAGGVRPRWPGGHDGARPAGQIDYAQAVARRLPRTFAALAAGLIHLLHLRIIEDETRFLKDEDAAAADEVLAEAARDKSFGQLRYAAHRLALTLDPESAARRKAAGRRRCPRRGGRRVPASQYPVVPDRPASRRDRRRARLRPAVIPGGRAPSSWPR
jgi:Domain of unknown function (DUF222)